MESFEHLRRADTVLLTTRRRDGRVVHTPVNLAVDEDGTGYFRTLPGTGKAKRLANFPGVRVAPSSVNGHPTGSDQPAVAEPLSGEQAEHARAVLRARFPLVHGRLAPLRDRLTGAEPRFYRVRPVEEPTPWRGTGTA
jgi:PPOX class probable F420-dependent enzyme